MPRASHCIAWMVVIAATLTLVGRAQSESLSQAWSWCRAGRSPDLQLKGCTIIIQSRRETPSNRSTAYGNRGIVWANKEDYDRALADYSEAIKIDPNNALPYANRGLIWQYKKEYDRALADFGEAISIDPANPNPYNNRGVTYASKGDYNRAIVDYNEAIRLRSTYATAYFNRDLAWFEKADYDRAVTDLSEALRLDPGYVGAFSRRAQAFFRKQDYAHSIEDYGATIKLDPQNPHWWNGRCFVRAAMGQLQDALADCNKSLQLEPANARTLDSRGLVYLKLGQFEAAIADYDGALKSEPTLAASLYGRGVAKIKKGNNNDGEADIAAATAIQSDVIEVFTRYGVPAITPAVAGPNVAVATGITPVLATPSVVSPERRVALVIGNSAYTKAPALPNPRRDAETIASVLRRVGFQAVTLEANLTRDRFIAALSSFASQAEHSDWALVYFAGHGIEMDGVNYLIPVDASLSTDRDVTYEAVPLGQILTAVDGAKKLRLVVLDACRNNPFLNQMRRTVASRSIGQGLGRIEPEAGTLVVYAAKHGEVALDGDQRNSPFVEALTNRILTPGIEVRRLFDLVRDDVIAATERRQQPFSYGSVSGSEDFYFVAR